MAETRENPPIGTVLIELDAADAAARWSGLPARVVNRLQRAGSSIDRGDFGEADRALTAARALAPNHPEVLRLSAVLLTRCGAAQQALPLLRQALAQWPNDVLAHNDLGDALRAAGDADAAYAIWRRACERAPDSAMAWFNLGRNLHEDAYLDEAISALETALSLAPRFVHARKTLADALVYAGQIERAAAEYRRVVQQSPTFGEAWWGLANIRTLRFRDDERAQMEHVLATSTLAEQARVALEFALAKAYEDHDRYAEAFASFARGNARMQRLRPWNAATFDAHVDEVIAAFSQPHAHCEDSMLGHEVIFIVSLPRAGSTLTEQILASHPQVEGASELPELMQVVQEESARRRQPFPHWVSTTSAADWQRLGRRYLELTARWRQRRPRFTDKQPYNWLLVGAARAMLPAARIVGCRRDPLETAWSCYTQIFPGAAAFSYRFDDIAAFMHAFDRAATFWREHHRHAVREQSYEALLDAPDAQTRELLAFCELPFDPACLTPHRNTRAVRSASAGQVREPIRRPIARSALYGALLDPLRQALGIATNV